MPLEMQFAEPSAGTPLIRSGSSFLIGGHEFLMDSQRWSASYSAVTETVVVRIPREAVQLVVVRDVDQLKQHAFSEVVEREIRPLIGGQRVKLVLRKDCCLMKSRGSECRCRAQHNDVVLPEQSEWRRIL